MSDYDMSTTAAESFCRTVIAWIEKDKIAHRERKLDKIINFALPSTPFFSLFDLNFTLCSSHFSLLIPLVRARLLLHPSSSFCFSNISSIFSFFVGVQKKEWNFHAGWWWGFSCHSLRSCMRNNKVHRKRRAMKFRKISLFLSFWLY